MSWGKSFLFIAMFFTFAARAEEFRFGRHEIVDVNGDGRPDQCFRVSQGILCRLGGDYPDHTRFWTHNFSDAADWNKPYYGETIQFADVNGDGLTDVCGRAGTGIVCELSNGRNFDRFANWSEEFSNGKGWAVEQFYRSIKLHDINGDGRADITGFGPDGFIRRVSDGTKFTYRQ